MRSRKKINDKHIETFAGTNFINCDQLVWSTMVPLWNEPNEFVFHAHMFHLWVKETLPFVSFQIMSSFIDLFIADRKSM